MPVTLRELYEQERKEEEIALVSGAQGLDHMVRWVHMVEGVEISTFLEGDEIVFTTGIALHSDAELAELVRFVFQNKAAGIVINTGPYIKAIPEAVLAFGEDNCFPIFEVPWRVHLANIMRYFAMRINMDTQKELELSSALKNAVYFSQNEELYLPTFLKYGYKREWAYCVVAAQFFTGNLTELAGAKHRALMQLARNYFHPWKDKVRVMELDESTVFLFANVSESRVKEAMDDFWAEAKKELVPDGVLFAGMGRNTKSIHCLGKCFRQAEQVKKLQRRKNRHDELLLYSKLGIYKILMALPNPEILQEYYNETLGALEKYDHVNETDYLYFLKQYFLLKCSAQSLAAEMHLHRNSVTYKMKKIEEITGLSVSDPDSRIKLELAFMIDEIL